MRDRDPGNSRFLTWSRAASLSFLHTHCLHTEKQGNASGWPNLHLPRCWSWWGLSPENHFTLSQVLGMVAVSCFSQQLRQISLVTSQINFWEKLISGPDFQRLNYWISTIYYLLRKSYSVKAEVYYCPTSKGSSHRNHLPPSGKPWGGSVPPGPSTDLENPRMAHLCTKPSRRLCSTWLRYRMRRTSWGVLSIHCPFRMGRSNMLLNSCRVPRKSGRTKSTMHQYSMRLFCRGYPVSTTRRRERMFFRAWEVLAWQFLMRCPSSQITTSGPGRHKAFSNSREGRGSGVRGWEGLLLVKNMRRRGHPGGDRRNEGSRKARVSPQWWKGAGHSGSCASGVTHDPGLLTLAVNIPFSSFLSLFSFRFRLRIKLSCISRAYTN